MSAHRLVVEALPRREREALAREAGAVTGEELLITATASRSAVGGLSSRRPSSSSQAPCTRPR